MDRLEHWLEDGTHQDILSVVCLLMTAVIAMIGMWRFGEGIWLAIMAVPLVLSAFAPTVARILLHLSRAVIALVTTLRTLFTFWRA